MTKTLMDNIWCAKTDVNCARTQLSCLKLQINRSDITKCIFRLDMAVNCIKLEKNRFYPSSILYKKFKLNTPNEKVKIVGRMDILHLDAPNATEIFCHGCKNLKSIFAPNVKILHCMECIQLVGLDLPKVVELFCGGCKKLKCVCAPKVESAMCDNCTELTSIYFPIVKRFYRNNCPKLVGYRPN